jgi:hypothetical protein
MPKSVRKVDYLYQLKGSANWWLRLQHIDPATGRMRDTGMSLGTPVKAEAEIKAGPRRALRYHWQENRTELAPRSIAGGPVAALAQGDKMRAYRMSFLTDAQVLELHDRAVAESVKERKIADEQDKAYWAERNRAYADCESNPSAKLRDPDHCNQPIPLGMMDGGNQSLVEPPDALFEDYVMGICAMVHSVREARRFQCLP